MGNSASNDKGSPRNNDSEFEQVEKDPTAAAAAAAAGGRSSPVMNDMSKSTVLVDKPTRRIVKASAPSSSTTASPTGSGTLTGSGSTESLGGDKNNATGSSSSSSDEDDDKNADHHQIGIQSDEEVLQDSIDQNRKARLQQLQQKQKSDRQHQLDERRKGNKTPSKVQVQANPFSRFLSAFSVEPEFPQHKRKEFQNEDSDLLPAKKVRKESDDDDGGNNSKKPSSSSLLMEYLDYYVLDPISQSNIDWKTAATATAVVVASVILVGQYSNRKKY